MRTTLNLDPDVSHRVQELARIQHRSMSRVVNELIRSGLESQPAVLGSHQVTPFASGQVLMDVTDISALLADLDDA